MNNYLLVSLIFFTGCYSSSEPMNALNQMIKKIDHAVKQEENLTHWASGYLGPYPFKGLDLQYNSREWVNLEESRRILIKTVDTIVKVVNENDGFAKHLRSIPFTSTNLLLSIEFSHDNTDRFVGFIVLSNDKISYSLKDPVTYKFTKIHRETIGEARQILQSENEKKDIH